MPLVACIGVLGVIMTGIMLISGTMAHLNLVLGMVVAALIMGMRVWLHRLDSQQRARFIFGRFLVGSSEEVVLVVYLHFYSRIFSFCCHGRDVQRPRPSCDDFLEV